jgi:hypothetical protein
VVLLLEGHEFTRADKAPHPYLVILSKRREREARLERVEGSLFSLSTPKILCKIALA